MALCNATRGSYTCNRETGHPGEHGQLNILSIGGKNVWWSIASIYERLQQRDSAIPLGLGESLDLYQERHGRLPSDN